MDMHIDELVYSSLCGQLLPEYSLPWVENAFAPGSECEQLYSQMLDAYQQLLDRLNEADEDEDVETIISNLLDIQKHLCLRMFHLGVRWGSAHP